MIHLELHLGLGFSAASDSDQARYLTRSEPKLGVGGLFLEDGGGSMLW
jgi:hypothetical protein